MVSGLQVKINSLYKDEHLCPIKEAKEQTLQRYIVEAKNCLMRAREEDMAHYEAGLEKFITEAEQELERRRPKAPQGKLYEKVEASLLEELKDLTTEDLRTLQNMAFRSNPSYERRAILACTEKELKRREVALYEHFASIVLDIRDMRKEGANE